MFRGPNRGMIGGFDPTSKFKSREHGFTSSSCLNLARTVFSPRWLSFRQLSTRWRKKRSLEKYRPKLRRILLFLASSLPTVANPLGFSQESHFSPLSVVDLDLPCTKEDPSGTFCMRLANPGSSKNLNESAILPIWPPAETGIPSMIRSSLSETTENSHW